MSKRPGDAGSALDRLARNVSDLAATRMREACVSSLPAMPQGETPEYEQGWVDAMEAVRDAIQSLTLDNVEQEKCNADISTPD